MVDHYLGALDWAITYLQSQICSLIGATPGALIVSIKVIKRAASGHTNPANRRWPTLLVAQRARRQLVSYDPTAGDRLSELWGRRGAQWERPNKSCDRSLCRSLCRVGVNQLTGLCRALRNQLTTSYLASVLK